MEHTLIPKNDLVRRHYDEVSQKWRFSIVDVIGLVTKTSDSRNYWKVLKNRLNKTHNQLVTACNQLKMRASDGKSYLTDTADQVTLHKIIELIPDANVSHFRRYLASLKSHEDQNEMTAESKLYPSTLLHKSIHGSYPHDSDSELQNITDDEERELQIDVYRKDDSIIVKTFIAGKNIENVMIRATHDTLIIRCDSSVSNYVIFDEVAVEQELYYGKYLRHIELPHEVEVDEIEATVDHGLLTIILPMIDKQYSKQIKIRHT